MRWEAPEPKVQRFRRDRLQSPHQTRPGPTGAVLLRKDEFRRMEDENEKAEGQRIISSFILPPSSLFRSEPRADVRQQPDVARALHGLRQHALLHRRRAGALAALDLAVAAQRLAQRLGVLVVD